MLSYAEGGATERGDGTQPACVGEAKQVEAAGEQDGPGDEQSAGGGRQVRVGPLGDRKGDRQQGQGVDHLVARGGLEGG